jgi:glycosyltransferase 2 family protein
MDRTTRRIGALLASSRYLVLLVLLGLAVHLILPQLTSLEHALQVIRTLSLWAVALAVVAQVGSYLGSGYLLREIVNLTHQRFSVVKGIMITLASSSVGVVAGGMVGTAAAT